MMTMSAHISLPFLSIFCFLQLGLSTLDLHRGGQVTVQIPPLYQPGFTGRALVLNAISLRLHPPPGFSAAVSVEATNGSYLCSLVVLMGDVKVWASDHSAKFALARSCALELAENGELRLTDSHGAVGWRSGTAMQGVQRLHLEPSTGNLMLLDALNRTTWQSFDYPTDTILQGQRLDVPSRLTAFPTASISAFYTFEFSQDKITASINFRGSRYPYWELEPPRNRTIAFARLGAAGLRIFDGHSRMIAQVSSIREKPVRLLALGRDGNLEMYYYSPRSREFRAGYKALAFCDLPLPCGLYGICTASGACEHVRLPRPAGGGAVGVEQGQYSSLCDALVPEVAMVELRGVATVIGTSSPLLNVTVEQCVDVCLRSCSCAAALYMEASDRSKGSFGVCSHYGLMAGAREVEGAGGVRYWVKVPAGRSRDGGDGISSRLVAKILIVGGVVDVAALLVIVGALVYYFVHVHKSNGNGVCRIDTH